MDRAYGRRERRVAAAEAAADAAFRNTNANAFLIPFLIALGGTPVHLGLLGSAPHLGRLGMLLVSGWAARSGPRQSALWGGLGDRLLFLSLASLPFLALGTWSPALALILVIAAYACREAYSVGTQAWFADALPEKSLGEFNAGRRFASQLSGWAITTALGIALFVAAAQSRDPRVLAPVMALGTVAGLWGLVLLKRLPAPPPMHMAEVPRLRDAVREAWQHPGVRSILTFQAGHAFAVGIASPFFLAFAVRELHFTAAETALLAATQIGTGLFMVRFWGRLTDRFGERPILIACGCWVALIPIAWIVLGNSEYPHLLFLAEVLSGLTWSGFNLAAANALVKGIPPERRVSWMSVNTVAVGLAAACAPAVGGALVALLSPMGPHAYRALFLLSALLRLLSLLPLRRMGSIRGQGLRRTLATMDRLPRRGMIAEAGCLVLRAPLWAHSAAEQLRPRPHRARGPDSRRPM